MISTQDNFSNNNNFDESYCEFYGIKTNSKKENFNQRKQINTNKNSNKNSNKHFNKHFNESIDESFRTTRDSEISVLNSSLICQGETKSPIPDPQEDVWHCHSEWFMNN
jgi:hypothetical protein